jgi:membrane fusion protein, multidrug efflux system
MIMQLKNKKMVPLIIAGTVVGGIVLVFHWIGAMGRISTDDAYIEGRVHSIAAKIPGTVKVINVKDNQLIKEGDVLMEIDPIDNELKVKEAQANLDIRKAALEQANFDTLRAETLYDEKVFPKERREKALTAFNLAKAQAEAAEAQLKVAERNLEYTKIYAPSDGQVTKKAVEVGNQIQPMQPLMAVVALDDIWVIANFKETQLKKVRAGQRVQIRVDTYSGKVFAGRVDSVMAGTGSAFSLFPPENALGNYVKVVQRIPVKIVFDKTADKGQALRIGMSCVPTIIITDR